MSRSSAREIAMRLLYEKDISCTYSKEALNEMKSEFGIDDGNARYIDNIIYGVEDNKNEIDTYIKKYVEGWRFDRISKIDLAILRLAIYELIWMDDIPYKVSINEAVELAKQYGSNKSSSFINGILGSIVRSEDFLGEIDREEYIMDKYILGIDTSCYTTSFAVVTLNGELIYNSQVPLEVKKGELGTQAVECRI